MVQCRTLENNALSKANEKYWFKMYGINNYSPLCFISGFPITSNLIQDPMHNLSKGINCYLLVLCLHRCIFEYNFFTLVWLNEKIQSYPFTGNDMKHVSKICTRHQLVNEVYIKQKVTAMTTLMFCLPHLLGTIFPDHDPHYNHFILLVRINQIYCSPYRMMEICAELEDLVYMFASHWLILYPLSSLKPKLHYLIHTVEMIKQFGSMHGLNCMRLEGKHGWFKDLHIRNLKKLPLTLPNKHQLYMCNKMIDIVGDYSTNFVYTGDEIGEGFMTSITSLNADIYETLSRHFGYKERFNLYETNRVKLT